MVISQLSVVTNVINTLSMAINDYLGLLMVISQLSVVISGFWLSISYQ